MQVKWQQKVCNKENCLIKFLQQKIALSTLKIILLPCVEMYTKKL